MRGASQDQVHSLSTCLYSTGFLKGGTLEAPVGIICYALTAALRPGAFESDGAPR